MQGLPDALSGVLAPFRHLFTLPTWMHVQLLLTGAILCHGARRVSSILRVMGLSEEKRFEKYHRVLNRARWNGMSCARILLGLLIGLLPDSFPLLIVVDDTIERRSGKKIKAKGCYRDACRSTQKKYSQMLRTQMGMSNACSSAAMVQTAMGTAIHDPACTLEKIK